MKTLLLLGGAALGLFLLTRKASAATSPSAPVTTPATQPGTNFEIMPTGGWAYPPLTPATFDSWCQANSGVKTGTLSNKCAIPSKGVYALIESRIKDPNDAWLLNDPDLF